MEWGDEWGDAMRCDEYVDAGCGMRAVKLIRKLKHLM